MSARTYLNDAQIYRVMNHLSANWPRYAETKLTYTEVAKEVSAMIGQDVIPTRISRMAKNAELPNYTKRSANKRKPQRNTQYLASVLADVCVAFNGMEPDTLSVDIIKDLRNIAAGRSAHNPSPENDC